jgi:soluble lytic murein transglycosylase
MPRTLFVFLLLTSGFALCHASGTPEITRAEAVEKLKKGDIGFILQADVARLNDLTKLDPSIPFYAGLQVESAGDKLRAARLYEAALGSPITRVRREAARKLIPLLAEFKNAEQAERLVRMQEKSKNTTEELAALYGIAQYVLGRYAAIPSLIPARDKNPSPLNISQKAWDELSLWNNSLRLLAALKAEKPGGVATAQNIEKFFLGTPVPAPASPSARASTGASAGSAYRWAYNEMTSAYDLFLPVEVKTAIAGRLAVLENAHREAVTHFSSINNDSLLVRYTPLINDMGRAYMSASSKREEGYKRLMDWETAIRTDKNNPISNLNSAEQNAVRYSLLFYAGRIRRQQAKHGEAATLFTRALALAPNAIQEDSCIWYILNSTFTDKPANTAALVISYASRWNNGSEFYTVLERLSCYLVSEKKWDDILRIFTAIRNGDDDATIARLAYLLGRAVSLGYISVSGTSAANFFTIAYEKGNASFYYRALAASRLGKTVTPTQDARIPSTTPPPRGDELEFYVKFFEFGARAYAMPYLRENADRYTKQEMRTISRTFAASGRYLESIQIIGILMNEVNYKMERVDLELYYPKPFLEIIERHARANNIQPYVLLGLVRIESAFIPDIVSAAGAVGLAQIMPVTGRQVAAIIKRRGGPDFEVDGKIDLTNPETNVHIGAVYLSDLTNSMGTPMLALMGYNGGPGRINRLRRAASSLPEDIFIETVQITETRNYGKRVMAAAAAYGYLYYGMSMHEIVSSIFK